MEIEEAVKNLNNYIFAIDNFGTIDPKCCNNLYEPVKAVLKELDKKDKVINEMARHFYDLDIAARISHTPTIYNFKSVKHAKEWFYEKVEEQE